MRYLKSFIHKFQKPNKLELIIFSVTFIAAIIAAIICVAVLSSQSKKANAYEDSSISSTTETKPQSIPLVITSPDSDETTTTNPTSVIKGSSDPKEPLTMNGQEIERNEEGLFSIDVNLTVGLNEFTFEHKGTTKVIKITYKYVIIKSYTPADSSSFECGSSFIVTAVARSGSIVTADFNGNTITLTPEKESQSVFTKYTGVFDLPKKADKKTTLGKVTFTADLDGKNEQSSSGDIICLDGLGIISSDKNVTPQYGSYQDVGSGYIAEVTAYNAETFNGDTFDDYSRPTNNYLPEGTLDYCAEGLLYDTASENSYARLRYGRRVYLDKNNAPDTERPQVINRYTGTLPDHNEITADSVVEDLKHTTLCFDVLWKAPFNLVVSPQVYTDESTQDYTVADFTAQYIDITFCYATEFNGSLTIPSDNPLFSSAEIVENESDTLLRLYLKKTGGFYGWDAYYNDDGQLCFKFLNPFKIKEADNKYGADLTGVKIMIDPGHGGKDIGAPGFDYFTHSEAIQNMSLAYKLKNELESIGATVVMTREDDSTRTSDDRIQALRHESPDYCIAIHHDSNATATPEGFSSFYFDAFSSNASKFIYQRTRETDIYQNYFLKWHYFYLARTTVCPVVLTENGYISNSYDYSNIIDESVNNTKTTQITQGIVDYFNSIK